ncbi:MAG: hypothetical protein WBB39_02320 [Candidatus Saccharimonadales bacterium]
METLVLQLFLLLNVFAIGVLMTLAIQHAREYYRPSSKQTDTYDPHEGIETELIESARKDFRTVIDRSTISLKKDLDNTNARLNALLEKLVTYAVNAEMSHYRENLEALHQQNESIMRGSMHDINKQHIDMNTKLIKRQAELDRELLKYQTDLERQMLEHQKESEMAIVNRQAVLRRDIEESQARHNAQQVEFEAKLTAHQTDVEAKLREHQNSLIAALDEREAKLADYQASLEAALTDRQAKQTALHDDFEAKLQAEIEAKKAFMIRQIDTKLADAVSSFLVETLGSNIDLGAQEPYLTSLLESHKEELKRGVTDA